MQSKEYANSLENVLLARCQKGVIPARKREGEVSLSGRKLNLEDWGPLCKKKRAPASVIWKEKGLWRISCKKSEKGGLTH